MAISTRSLSLVLLALVGCLALPGTAAAQPLDCTAVIEACQTLSDEEILKRIMLGPAGPPAGIGTCYAHDKSTCPNCACDNYLKVSYGDDQKGYDGGTGCIWTPDPDGKRELVEHFWQMCMRGACCCPVLPEKECPAGGPVGARDPLTGSCCEAPNPCSLPPGWHLDPSCL